MKSLSTLVNLGTSLTQNLTSSNQSTILQLLNDQQRYLLQKYFDNERSYSVNTVGGTSLTLASSPSVGDTSATLSTGWNYASCIQLVNFGDGEVRNSRFVKGSSTISWDAPLDGLQYQLTNAPSIGDTSATLSTAWPNTTQTITGSFSDGSTKSVTFTSGSQTISWTGGLSNDVEAWVAAFASNTAVSTTGVSYYPIPAGVSKITDNTITVGSLKFTIIPIQTRQDWDRINFIPYTSDIPQYAFIYNGTLGIFPIPATTGNILSFNYKTRVPDFSTAFLFSDTNGTAYVAGSTTFDYQKGTVAGAINSYTVTGSGTSWTTPFPTGDVTQYNLYLIANPTKGDGLPYQIKSIDSDTSLTLSNPLMNTIASGASYSIAQMPVLFEDFHDTLIYGVLKIYYNSIVKDKIQFELYDGMHKERLILMEDYIGTKQINVDLGSQPQPKNPNIYLYANTSS